MVRDMSVFYVCFQHVWPHWVHVCWWSTTLWMARTFRWRRPWKLVTPWCIPSLKSSSMRAGLKKPSLMTSYSCIKRKKTPSSSWGRRRRTPARRNRRPMILTDTSCQTCQRPPWSSPPSYPPRPRCRWPLTHMYLWSVRLSWEHKKISGHPPSE